MNDRNGSVGGYISLTTHELNINQSKYNGRGARFSGSEKSNSYDRSERSNGRGRAKSAVRNQEYKPRAANDTSERKTFRLRKI